MLTFAFENDFILLYSLEFFFLLVTVVSFVYFTALLSFSSLAFPCSLNISACFNLFLLAFVIIAFMFSTHVMLEKFHFFDTFIKIFTLFSLFVLIISSKPILYSQKIFSFEYDFFVVFSAFGLILLICSKDFLLLYLALEIQTLCFYVLSSYCKNSSYSVEAGLKYFVIGALFSCVFLLGVSLLYLFCGSIIFTDILDLYVFSSLISSFFPFTLIIATFFFKLGAFPFHFWVCDVYEGSLVTVTALFSLIPKLTLVALLSKLLLIIFFPLLECSYYFFIFCGLGSVIFGALAGLYQKRLKRLLNYSGISHIGFVILAFCSICYFSLKAAVTYILIYVLMTLCLFVLLFKLLIKNYFPKYLINYSALYLRNICFGFSFSLLLFCNAGIPPFAGFYSKLCVFFAILTKKFFISSLFLVFFSCLTCYYYIRLIKIICFRQVHSTPVWLGKANTFLVDTFLSLSLWFLTFLLCRPYLLLSFTSLISLKFT